jgi:ATP-dependent Clp protease ATP-binding subunit ClpC
MRAPPSEPDLLVLRRLAEELAQSRKERTTSGHLLAAIVSHPSQAAELLLERRLGAEVLLKAARATTDEEVDPLARAVQRAREFAGRMGTAAPGPIHLLLALIHDRKTGAHRALAQCGVDVSRLRGAAMQLALGRVGPRRNGQSQERVEAPRPSTISKTPSSFALGTTISSAVEGRFALDPKSYPVLTSLGKNLTELAALGKLDVVTGRDVEIDQALDILAKRRANNPMLLGPAGVGKTSVVMGIAQRIANRDQVSSLDDRILIEIPISELLAGTAVRGSLAERVAAIRKEVLAAAGRVVIFFDEVHTLFSGDIADEIQGELKVALARGELPCIGATTHDEYKRTIECDAALARRFSAVEVDEPTPEAALAILTSSSPALAAHHHVTYDDQAIASAITWSVRYLPFRVLPDKALSVLDLAGARARRRSAGKVNREGVAEVIAELAEIPIERLLETDGARMLALESLLAARVVGHAAALSRMANILRRNAVGLRGHRPIGTFLLLGPTGVGKTESAKAIAHTLFHSENAMTRIDMAEYAEPHALARLIGAPPGYIGHDAGGQLTEAVRKRPYQVLLLDEIEKAHRDVLDSFLGVFDEGRLTDGRGRTIDFTNTVIVLTSNIGASEVKAAKNARSIGFGKAKVARSGVENTLLEAARAALAPELYNRIDEVIAYAPLERSEVAEIARRLLASLGRTLHEAQRIHLDVEDEAVEALLDAGGYDPELGARPMKRTIARSVEAPIAEMVLRGELREGDVARLTLDGGEIVVDVVREHSGGRCRPAPSKAAGNFVAPTP